MDRALLYECSMRSRAALILCAASALLGACSSGDGLGTSADELSAHEVIAEGTSLRVTASTLHLRDDASLDASIVADLNEGDVVTCVETSGERGWVHVADDSGDDGWVFGKYLAPDGQKSGAASGPTCDPSRATGAVNRYEKALHDAIAYAEGTRDHGKDGYDVLFSNREFASCHRHPTTCLAFGGSCSTAAGRYQFLTTTWSSVASANGLSSFEPENQEKGAAYLITNVRRADVPSGRALSASEFYNVMSKLSYEWASLPPGRYGQPSKSMSQMRSVYCREAGC